MKRIPFAAGTLAVGTLAVGLGLVALAGPVAAQTYVRSYEPVTVYEVSPSPVYGQGPYGRYYVAPQQQVIIDDPEPVVVVPQPVRRPYAPTFGVRSNFDDARVDPSSIRVSPSGRVCRTIEVDNNLGMTNRHTYCD